IAPYIAPWSVMARAGISSSAARATMALIRLAPSSSENSVWLWRWTNVSGACGIGVDGMAGLPILDFPCGCGSGPRHGHGRRRLVDRAQAAEVARSCAASEPNAGEWPDRRGWQRAECRQLVQSRTSRSCGAERLVDRAHPG